MLIDDLTPLSVTWQAREPPLVAAAVAARGSASVKLAQRLLESGDDALAELKGVCGPELFIVVGDEESLPWVDGVIYLGRDPAAPSLLVPTMLEPSVPLALVERALTARFPATTPLALLAVDRLVVPLSPARPVKTESLRRWLESYQKG